MHNKKIYPNLDIYKKIAACLVPGIINATVFTAFSITDLSDRKHVNIMI